MRRKSESVETEINGERLGSVRKCIYLKNMFTKDDGMYVKRRDSAGAKEKKIVII